MIDITHINGRVEFTASYDGRGNLTHLYAEWIGGNIIGVTPEVIELGDPRFIYQNGDEIQICQYRLKILETADFGQGVKTYICQRMHD